MSTPSRDSFGLGQSQTPTYKSNADLFDEYFKYTRDSDPTSLYHPVQDQWEMDTLSDDFLEFVTFAEKARKETPDFNELIKRIETEPWGPLKKEKPSPAEHGKKLFREMRERGMMKRSIGVGGATDFDRHMAQRGIRRAGKHFLHSGSGLPVLAGMLEKTRTGGLGGKLITKGVRAAEKALRVDEPIDLQERIGEQVVGLAGLIKGVPGGVGGLVGKAAGAVTNPYFLKIGKALLGQKAGHIVGKTIGGAFEHGMNLGATLTVASEEFSAKEMAKNFWEGNKMGWLFFGGSFIGAGGKAIPIKGEQTKGLAHAVFKKTAPLLTHIVRQGFNRAVGSQMGVYDPAVLDKIKAGKWEEIDGQEIFNDLLFAYFSRKPINKHRFFLDLSKINAEMAELTPKGLRLKPWNPYYESPEMQERMAQVPASFTGRARGAPEFTQKQLTAGPRAEGKPEGKWSVDTSVDRNVGVFNYRGRRIMISETAPQGEGGSLWYVISDPATKVPKMGTAAPDYTIETKDRLLRKIVSEIDAEQGPEPGSVGEFPLVGPDSRYNEEFFEIPGQVRMEPQRGVTGIPTRIAGGVVPDFFVLPSGEVFPVALFEQTSSPGELKAMIEKAYSLQSTTIAPERMLPGKVEAKAPFVPPEASILPPIKDGFVRVFHSTRADESTIREKGLLTGKEKGGTIEEAPVVFGTKEFQMGFGGDKVVVADVPKGDVATGGKEIRVNRSVRPDEIVDILHATDPRLADHFVDGKYFPGAALSRAEYRAEKVGAELPGPPVAPAVEPKAAEFMPHAGEAVSAEALSRQKTIRFFAYDTATKKIRPMIGVDAIDAPIKPREIRLQQNLNTGKVEALDRGSKAMGPDLDLILKRPDVKEAIAIKEPVPPKVKSIRELAEELGHDIDQPPPPTEKSIRQIAEQLGFDLDEVMRESSKRATEEAKKITADKLDYYSSGLNLFKALESWGDHLYSKYADPKTAPPELKKELKINAAMAANVTREERTFKIGRRVLTNLYSMGKGGEKIGDASIKFIKGRSQAEQYDLFRLMSAFDVMAREIPRAQKMRKPFKTADVVASKMFDMMEGKVQPKTAGEKTAYKVLDTLRTEVAAEAERVGLKVSTLGGEAKEWAPRKDYAPVEYTNLRRFLESKSFKHLRDMYIDELAKRLDPELYKADKERAILIAEDNFLSLKADMRSRKFGHLERERVLDESLLEKIRKRWEVAHPGEKFPLERKRTLDVWVRYFTGARERLAWIDAFGKDLYVKGVGYVPSKLRDMRLDLSEPNYRYVESIFSRYLKQGAPLDSRLTRYLRGIRTYQLTKLAFAFIPNSLQWFTNTIPQIDLKTAFEVIPDLAKYAGLNGKEIKARQREWFSKTGAQTYKHAFSMTMLDNPEKLSKFADIMLKVHGFSGTESFNAIFAAHAGARHQIAISKKLYEASKKQSGIKWYRRPFYASELKKYGLKAEDIEAISKDGPLTFEKNMQATLDAGFHMRRTTQFLADMFHLPSSWSTPFGRLLTQFKNFSYNQSALVIDSARQLGKWANPKAKGGIFSEGSPMPFIKMMPALTIAGALIHAFKKETYPAIGMHFYEELTAGKSWPYMVGMYLANSGGLGMLMDITNAAQFGGASMLEMVGGPTASDFMQLADSIGKTHDELMTAWEYKYPGWIVKRRHRLASHWLKMLEAMSPDSRLVVQNWFPNYKKTKTFANWSNVVTDAYDRYRMLYKTKSPERADEFWGFFMETQGAEYEEVTGKQPRKPTAKEVEKWWVDRDKAPADAMSVPGITPKKNKTLGQFEFWR